MHAHKRSSVLAAACTTLTHLCIGAALVFAASRAPALVMPLEKGPVTVAIRVPAPQPERPAPPKEVTPPQAPAPPQPAPPPKTVENRPALKRTAKPAVPRPPAETPPPQEAAPAETAAPPQAAPVPRSPDADERQRLLAQLMAAVEEKKFYPLAARRAGMTGTVTLKVRIDDAGRISGVELGSSPSPMLASAAAETLDAVRKGWKAKDWPGGTLLVHLPIRYEIR